jgi:RNA polymerase sigma-54 factor
MDLSARLQLRQGQSLVITPQLMQAIRLLQMSGLELETYIAAELEQNPLLEQGEGPKSGPEDVADADDAAQVPPAEAIGTVADMDAEPADLNPEADSAPGRSSSLGQRNGGGDWDELGRDQTLPAVESLEQLLERKIDAVFAHAPGDRFIALGLAAALDEAGYLTEPAERLASQLGAAAADVERVLGQCQALAPTGVFARSLAESLTLQLEERGRIDRPMRVLLQNLSRLAAGERAALALACGVDAPAFSRMVEEIRSLDPKPGLAFTHEPVRTQIPDVFVRRAPGGAWRVELNEDALPRVLVNRTYYAKVSARIAADDERRYLSECLQKACWLEKSLDQRARTVLRVATEIVRRQARFLVDGVAYLKPLNLRMVADTLGIHESTVSRAAANKTIATPRGIFEFRYFFTGAIAASAGGDAHSAEAVKHRIRKMIDQESPDAVFSDDAIVAVLAREGVEIARRTVAKYREVMQIGSSVERRRAKRLKAAS